MTVPVSDIDWDDNIICKSSFSLQIQFRGTVIQRLKGLVNERTITQTGLHTTLTKKY